MVAIRLDVKSHSIYRFYNLLQKEKKEKVIYKHLKKIISLIKIRLYTITKLQIEVEIALFSKPEIINVISLTKKNCDNGVFAMLW